MSRRLVGWLQCLPAAERRKLREAWQRGEIGLPDLIKQGDSASAPPLEVVEQQARHAAVTVFDDVPPVLVELRRRGYRLVTISNVVEPSAHALRSALAPWMAGFVLSCDIGACKPDAAPFQPAAEQLALPLHRILMVGDSQRGDIDGAAAVGMPTIRVDRAGNGRIGIADLSPLLEWLPGGAAATPTRSQP